MGEGLVPSDGLRTHEPPTEIERFTPEAIAALNQADYEIYELTGKSYEEIVEELPPDVIITTNFFPSEEGGTVNDRAVEHLKKMRSLRTEVAIPRSVGVFLPDSDTEPEQQRELLVQYSADLSEKVPDARAIEGDTLDYVELAIAYAKRHKSGPLYGGWTNRKHAATRSGLDVGLMPKEGINPARISILMSARSFRNAPLGSNNEGPWVAPLVVPAKTPSPTPAPIQT